MLKKIALGALLTGLVAVLVLGAVIRTNAKTNEVAGEGGRHGRTTETSAAEAAHEEHVYLGEGNSGRWGADAEAEVVTGQGGGRWAQQDSSQAPFGNGIPQADVLPAEWTTIEGIVSSAADDLVEIETASGETVPFEGQPLRYALQQGFTVQVGDAVSLHGFDEDGEFKIGQVTNLGSGATVTLRDTSGRPGWSGQGRGWQG